MSAQVLDQALNSSYRYCRLVIALLTQNLVCSLGRPRTLPHLGDGITAVRSHLPEACRFCFYINYGVCGGAVSAHHSTSVEVRVQPDSISPHLLPPGPWGRH